MKKIATLFAGCLLLSCGNSGNKIEKEEVTVARPAVQTNAPEFSADSAYAFVDKQVQFGPRVPNSAAHKACAAYLQHELERFGATTFVQQATLTAYNGDRLEASNIVGVYNPDNPRRILLCAHWDSRPYSDHDKEEFHHTPIDGADDGASGVGVLLEIARQISRKGIDIGVDIVFFDAEDYGTPEFVQDSKPDTWCLGSQFWSKKPHTPGYRADFGILLDMVGSRGATFYKEATSVYYASPIVEMVWSTARKLGYANYFINAEGGGITDDHLYVNRHLGIPCIDIINTKKPGESHTGFGTHWHTQNDGMENIDRQTLKAAGQTVLEVIYSYK